MKSSLFREPLAWLYEHFKKDTSKMLIITGTLGWALSSAAQILGVAINSKIPKEQKPFLVTQEGMDAVVNIISFLTITTCAKKLVAKLASTGKIAPRKVRDYLNKNKDVYADKVGKIDFDLDEVLKKDKRFPAESYYTFKNFATTVGTVGASILSCNIVTPIVRNNMASRVQNQYIDMKNNPEKYPVQHHKYLMAKHNSNGMKV